MPFEPAKSSRDELVLLLAPTGRDGPLARSVLHDRGGIESFPCRNVEELCQNVNAGAGAILVAEETLHAKSTRRLVDCLGSQLPWSDLPVIVLASTADTTAPPPRVADSLAALRQRGNVTVLDRPLRIVTLLTSVQSALRARRRQYQVRDLLAETRNAVKQRDQFLAMLGHELRNPLGAISNALTVIDVADANDAEIRAEQHGIIRRQTNHLGRLVDDLLDVSRITSGKIALQRQPIDLCDLARHAAQSVEASARTQRHELIVEVYRDPVVIDADPVRIEQVINNLLTNAIKYTPPRGHIRMSVEPAEGEAIIRVNDDGIGIPPELIGRVFDLFTQAERALDRAQGGLGIGLTLVRSLVEMHDGTVQVHSDGPGQGSEFVITLPRVKAAAAPSKPQRSHDDQPTLRHGNNGHGRRILVIEDQPDARRALQRLLQIWGYQVEVAEDGPGGVEAAAKTNPDVAFVDVGLPGLDGYEVARRIRATMGDRVRLIALTGYGQPEDRDRAHAAGFDLHLVKPVDRDELAKSVSDSR